MKLLRPAVLASAIVCCAAGPLSAQDAPQDTAMVAVAARDLPRGVALESTDIAFVPRDSVQTRGSADVEAGWLTKRVIREGEVLRPPAVAAPSMVTAGQQVHVIWRRGALELRLRGTALRDAALGEPVQVRVDTRRHLKGIAAGPGLVRIDTQPIRGS